MPVSYNHKIIFIHIPKCAGTTVEYLLQTRDIINFYTEGLPLKTLNDIPSEKFTDVEFAMCASKNKQHYTYRELANILPEDIVKTFQKITIVRNPYDRLVSEYYFHKNVLNSGDSFENFVNRVLKLNIIERNWLYDGHLETQTSFLINKENNFNSIDKIFKFEELNDCFDYLKKVTGKNNIPHTRAAKGRRPWPEYYNLELKEKVFNFYKEDFINFNYCT